MTRLTWDASADRKFETGVDQGILFIKHEGAYLPGIAWNGLVTVTESPAGAEATKQYADNIPYLNLLSAETFGGTIEAFTYPDEFTVCDGGFEYTAGVSFGQQPRATFGLAYRTKVGNADDQDAGYKWHLVYNILASPSEKAHATVNDTPAPLTFSWAFTTTPEAIDFGLVKPTSLIIVDSTKAIGPFAAQFLGLENQLIGTVGTPSSLPLPADVFVYFD